MMNMNEQKSEVVNLLSPSRRFRSLNQNVNEIQEINKQRMIKFLQLFLAIKVLRIQSFDLLTFQRPYDCIVI